MIEDIKKHFNTQFANHKKPLAEISTPTPEKGKVFKPVVDLQTHGFCFDDVCRTIASDLGCPPFKSPDLIQFTRNAIVLTEFKNSVDVIEHDDVRLKWYEGGLLFLITYLRHKSLLPTENVLSLKAKYYLVHRAHVAHGVSDRFRTRRQIASSQHAISKTLDRCKMASLGILTKSELMASGEWRKRFNDDDL